jgi:hypothetical protein
MKSKTFYIKVMEHDRGCSTCQALMKKGSSCLTWDYQTVSKVLPLSYCLDCAILTIDNEKEALDSLVACIMGE